MHTLSRWLILSLLISIAACSGKEKFLKPELSSKGRASFNSLQKAVTTIELSIHNKNNYPVVIESGSFQVYLGKINIGKTHLRNTTLIPPRSHGHIPVNITVEDKTIVEKLNTSNQTYYLVTAELELSQPTNRVINLADKGELRPNSPTQVIQD